MITSLQCDIRLGSAYKSATQIARVVTEHWGAQNLYCAACKSEELRQSASNTKAIDFRCKECDQTYQLKSQKILNLMRVPDGAYDAMLTAVKLNAAPNLLILNYSHEWAVRSLFLIPSVFFTDAVLQRRRPLSPAARRAGWVGCNIVLANVPDEAKIPLIHDTQIVSPQVVRAKFSKYQKLASVEWNLRGWTLDVLAVARKLGPEFTLQQIYQHDDDLSRLHPANRNIRAKIRQQLQLLRNLKFLQFLGGGRYRFNTRESPTPECEEP